MMLRRMKYTKRWIALAAVVAMSFTATALVYLPALPTDAPTVLVSVDRTLWNRIGLNRLTHVRALKDAGIRPLLVDFEIGKDDSFSASDLLHGMDGLILAGGGDVDSMSYGSGRGPSQNVNPKRDQFEIALLDAAEKLGLPILGICRGAQLINVHRGGTLGDFRADSTRYQRHHRVLTGHPVNLDAGSRLASIFGETQLKNVVTFHGQHVVLPGTGVQIVGYSPDGTPEAFEIDTGSEFGILGVQWHAEVVPWDSHQAKLFRALSEAAASHRAARVSRQNR